MAGLYTWSFRKEMQMLEMPGWQWNLWIGREVLEENKERKKKGEDIGQNSENISILNLVEKENPT